MATFQPVKFQFQRRIQLNDRLKFEVYETGEILYGIVTLADDMCRVTRVTCTDGSIKIVYYDDIIEISYKNS